MPTIALVANDRNLVTSVSVTLEAEGYRIAAYTDGASALSGFQTAPPDLAILDIKMPRLDGAEALRLLRAKSDLPVIFLTSTKEVIDEVFALEMGADDGEPTDIWPRWYSRNRPKSQSIRESVMARVLLVGYDPETVDYSNPALPPGMSAEKIKADSTQILPPCISMMRFDMASPKPVPPFLRVMALSAC